MDLPNGLSHQIGPLPVAGWVGVLGGAFLISHYLRNKAAVGGTGGLLDLGGANKDATDPTTTPGAGGPATNDEWLQKAERELIGRGYDASIVDDALRRYTHGGDVLNLQEQAIVNAALIFAGPLPQPLPPSQHGPIPIPKPPVHRPPPTSSPPPPNPPFLPHNLPGVNVPAGATVARTAPGHVVGLDQGGHSFVYDGTAQQAAAIVGAVPPPNPPGQAAFDAQVADVLRARTEW